LAHLTVYKHFKKLVKSIGLSETRFHDSRHTYAVASLQSGDDVKIVQENLGHHTASFTLNVYGHVSERMKKDSAQRMEGFIKDVSRL
jgi:integrase